jgi:hypothetical protein
MFAPENVAAAINDSPGVAPHYGLHWGRRRRRRRYSGLTRCGRGRRGREKPGINVAPLYLSNSICPVSRL